LGSGQRYQRYKRGRKRAGNVTIGNFLSEFVTIFVQVLTWAIIIRALLSWFSVGAGGIQQVFRLLVEITEPVMGPIRRVLPTLGAIDFSPLVALILVRIVGGILAGLVSTITIGH